MSASRTLNFDTEADIIRDVQALRAGCTQDANWTLPQTCWHLNTPLDMCLKEPASREPTEAQDAMQARLDDILAAGVMPRGIPAPPGTEPAARVDDSAVDAFIGKLHELKNYPHSHVDFGPFGPVTIATFRKFNLIHSAHHLQLLHPTT